MVSKATYDYIFKIVLVGDTACGKSSLLSRYIEHKFDDQKLTTIGVEFGTSLVSLNDKTIKLQIWDTAGQERFKSVTRSYFRQSFGAIMVYDVTRRETFEHITMWLNDARNLADPDCVICLVGNKNDLPHRAVSMEEGKQFADDNGLLFVETSAKDNVNVDDLFINTAQAIFDKVESGKIEGMSKNNNLGSECEPTGACSC
ncbi:hypothetical protein P9112_000293 [Eukaryota sp. TZLM1-RC]